MSTLSKRVEVALPLDFSTRVGLSSKFEVYSSCTGLLLTTTATVTAIISAANPYWFSVGAVANAGIYEACFTGYYCNLCTY